MNCKNITLYFILQQQLYEDIIKWHITVDMFITCSQFVLWLFYISMADVCLSLSQSAVNCRSHRLYSIQLQPNFLF